ncbi:hypothetical protein [Bradyrhizobium sp. dw_78]|uniref:alpha/beta fold hydrolase n=1 Tax=Bradyrhizobium sp. dw_78 TaxID=2719793 RepID=UPI00201C2474|nr:hypothetical protein [Bradyrhizobium sp. dw_78]
MYVILVVGDEDAACLDTNLMLKATLPNAGLWIAPNTGHTVNLEVPAASMPTSRPSCELSKGDCDAVLTRQ